MDAPALEHATGVRLADRSHFRSLPWGTTSEDSMDIPGGVHATSGGMRSFPQEHFTGAAQHLQRHGDGIWRLGAYAYTAVCPYDYSIEHAIASSGRGGSRLERKNLVRRK